MHSIKAELVAVSALASEATFGIQASAISANVKPGPALINVLASIARAHAESVIAPASIGSKGVDTRSITTSVGDDGAFIDINARISIG